MYLSHSSEINIMENYSELERMFSKQNNISETCTISQNCTESQEIFCRQQLIENDCVSNLFMRNIIVNFSAQNSHNYTKL